MAFVNPFPWTPMTTSALVTMSIWSLFERSSNWGTWRSTFGSDRMAETSASCALGVRRRLAAPCLQRSGKGVSQIFERLKRRKRENEPADIDDDRLLHVDLVLDPEVEHHAVPDRRPPISRCLHRSEDIFGKKGGKAGQSASRDVAEETEGMAAGRTSVHLVPSPRRRIVPMRRPSVEDDHLVKDVQVLRARSVC